MKYGIANNDNETSLEEISSILNLCKKSKIDTIDTALDYGSSEIKLGLANVNDFKVVTKIPSINPQIIDASGWIRDKLIKSLERLKINSVYGLLLHKSSDLLLPNKKYIVQGLNNLKEEGLVKKIGCSIYSPNDLNYILNSIDIDIVQAPFNILDRRLVESGWLSKLKNFEVEIHTRSSFLQGLLLMPKGNLPSQFRHSEELFKKWYQMIEENNISQLSACLSFVRSYKDIDKVLIGVQNTRQLNEILKTDIFDIKSIDTKFMSSQNLELIDPTNW